MSNDNSETRKETPEEMRARLDDLEKRISEKNRQHSSDGKLAGFKDDYSHDLHGQGEARHDEDE